MKTEDLKIKIHWFCTEAHIEDNALLFKHDAGDFKSLYAISI